MELRLGAANLSVAKRSEPVDDAALIDRCRRQDLEAFGKLLDAYQARVFGFVRRMVKNTDEASDLTQEVFIRAYQSFSKFDGRCSVKTWLFRIAYNLCVDRSRRCDRSPVEVGMQSSSESDEWLEIADARWEPERLAIEDELAKVIEEAICSMSEKLKSVLLLHDREDASYEEIAIALDLPIGTVKSRLFLARSHLQNCLRPYLQGEKI